MGEQPNPWDRLYPRMRRADIELNLPVDVNLGEISLLSPRVAFLSVERWPFHVEPPITKPDLRPCSSCSLAVKPLIPLHSASISNHSEGTWAPPATF